MPETGGNETGRIRRVHVRAPTLCSGSLYREGVSAVDCVVRDLSVGGAHVVLERSNAGPELCVLDLDGVGLFPSKIVWQRDNDAGLEFLGDPEATRFQINAAVWGRFRMPS
jgi:hypothetical protein